MIARGALLLLVLAAGCGAGYLPVVGQHEICMRVVEAWKDRGRACHKSVDGFDAAISKCRDVAGVDFSEPTTCLDEIARLPCEQIATLPRSCDALFFGGAP